MLVPSCFRFLGLNFPSLLKPMFSIHISTGLITIEDIFYLVFFEEYLDKRMFSNAYNFYFFVLSQLSEKIVCNYHCSLIFRIIHYFQTLLVW